MPGITIDFNANIARFNTQIDRVSQRLDSFQQHTASISSRVNDALGKIGVGISVAGLSALAKSGIDALDAIGDLSARTGLAEGRSCRFG